MRKRVFSLFVALGTTLSLLAYDFQSGDLYYTITSSTDPLTVSVAADAGGSYASLTTVTIPETVTNNDVTYSVTGIETNAFSGCTNLTSVVWNAKNCQSWGSYKTAPFHSIAAQITSFTFGEGVELIPYAICDGMTALSNVTLPESTKIIKGSVFYGCTGLTSISIPTNVDTIGLDAFKNCSQLTSVTWNAKNCRPNYYQGALSTPFYAIVSQMTSFTFGDSVECIPDGLMMGMSNISAITIPLHVDSIGGCDAFSGCSSLTSIVWNAKKSKTLKAFGEYWDDGVRKGYFSVSPFLGICGQITSFTFGDQVENVPGKLLGYMENLTSISLPESVTSIGDVAFEGCSALSSITIPVNVDTIGANAFRYCSSLSSVVWNAKKCKSTRKYNSLVSPFYGAAEQITSFTFGDQVESLPDMLFKDMENLTFISLPEGITVIGEDMFRGCRSLSSISIPESVTSIGGEAFYDCYALSSITIPVNVDTIGANAFGYNSSLSSVVWNAKNCKTVKVLNRTYDYEIGEYKYYYDSQSPFYGAAEQITSFTFGDQVESLPDRLCEGMKNLSSILLPDGITAIGERMFYDCYALSAITIPESVQSIGESAFSSCRGLTSITIPNSVKSIGGWAFSGCYGIKKTNFIGTLSEWCQINTGSTPVEYSHNLYLNDVLLTHADIPDGVTTIHDDAFNGDTCLVSITIPNSVTYIGKDAFDGCYNVETVMVGNGVETIDEYAFYDCSALKKFVYESPLAAPLDVISYKADLDTLIAPATVLNTYYMSPSTHVRYIKIHSGEITERGFAALLGSYKTLGTIDLAGASNTGMADRTFYECYNLTQLSLPAQLEAIPYKMIADCYMLQSITIPATVTEIDNNAFENCRSLQTVNFAANNALQRIGNWAFYNCHALQTISIPEGVTYVGDGAFYGCTYLTNITLPSTMLAMGDNSFALCSKLQQMNVRANIPPTIASKTFYNVLRTIPVYVPMDAVAQYKADTYWREFNIIGSDAPSDTENVLTDAATPTRIVRDGKVLVYSNGKWYDMLGNIVE